ncbi:MAG: hypothetical protein ACRDF9_14725, partial [Candidatus Limnocylindria bacterium]
MASRELARQVITGHDPPTLEAQPFAVDRFRGKDADAGRFRDGADRDGHAFGSKARRETGSRAGIRPGTEREERA